MDKDKNLKNAVTGEKMEEKDFFYKLTLKSLFENTGDMIFVKDTELRYITVSKAFAKMVNRVSEEEFLGKTDFELFDNELAEKYRTDDKKLLKLGKDIGSYIEPLPDVDGRKKYCSTSKYILRNESGEVVGLYGVSRDVTAEVELLEQREKREQSSLLFEAVLEADLTLDKMVQAEGVAWVGELELKENSTFSDTVSHFIDSFIDENYKIEFKKFYDRETLLNDFNKGITSFSHICMHSKKGNKPHYIELESRLHFSRITSTVKMTTFIKDIDEDYRKKEELSKKALTDNLSGLYNREGFELKVKERLKKQKGFHALIFIDLDCFKQINDNYGHLYGDKVICEIAAKLKNFVGAKHVVGRFGGDEFVLFTAAFSSLKELEAEVEKILSVAQYYKFENSNAINITCSVGATLYQENKTFKELYAEADAAMYSAKQNGKNCYAFFKEGFLVGKLT